MSDTIRLTDATAPETFDTSWAQENSANMPVLSRADMDQHQQVVDAYSQLLTSADAPHEELAKAQLADRLAPLLKMPKQWVLANVAELGAQMSGAPKTPHGLLAEVGQSFDLGVKQVDLANKAAILMAQAKTGKIDPAAYADAKKLYDETNLMGGGALPLSKMYAKLKGQALSDPLAALGTLGSEILKATANQLPQLGVMAAGAAGGGAIGAGVGALAGAMTPAEAATIPAGILTGMWTGASVAGAEQEAGQMFADLLFNPQTQGIDPNLAAGYAATYGVIAGALERLGLQKLPGVSTLLKKASEKTAAALVSKGTLRTAVSEHSKSLGKDFLVGWGTETTTEAAQQAAQSILTELAKQTANQLHSANFTPADVSSIVADVVDAGWQAALAFPLMGGIGTGFELSLKSRSTVAEWKKQGIAEQKVKAATVDIKTAQAIAAAPMVADSHPVQTSVVGPAGEAITVYHPVSQEVPDGNGVAFYTDRNDAEAQAHGQSTGPLEPNAYLGALRTNYPGVVADAAQAVIQHGRDAAAPFADQLKAWDEQNPTMDHKQLLDLALSIHDGSVRDNRNEVLVQYGLQSALPSGGIVEAKIQADQVAHVDSEDQIAQAFKDGAQAVEFAGVWRVKDAQHVVKTGITDSRVQAATKNPVGQLSFQANDGTTRALTGKGAEAGRLKTEVSGDTVSVHELTTAPEYQRQGVAKALVARLMEQHPGKTIVWPSATTPDGKAFQSAVRKGLPTWDAWGSRIDQAMRAGKSQLAEYYRQKADTIPDPIALLGDRQLTRDQVMSVLTKGMAVNEAEAAMAIMDRMAEAAGTNLDGLLNMAVNGNRFHGFQWVSGVRDERGVLHESANGATTLGTGGVRLIQLVQGKANVSTVLHEMAHVVRPLLAAEDQATLLSWTGEKTWNRAAEEFFARGFEQYLGEGHKTGDSRIDAILEKLAGWLRMIYDALFDNPVFTVGGKPVMLTDEARTAYKAILDGQRGTESPGFGAPVNEADMPLFQESEEVAAVRVKYEGTPAYGLAPNGQKSNLTERQWLHVRTPSFKRWFGDWELEHKAMPVIRVESLGWKGSTAELRELAKGFYTENIQGKSVRNQSLGANVQFSAEGKNDTYGTSRGTRNPKAVELVRVLDSIVQTAELVQTNPPEKGREKDSRAFHTLVNAVEIDGSVYGVRVTVREALQTPDGKFHKFYSLSALEIKKGPDVPGVASQVSLGPLHPASSEPLSLKVGQIAESVNVELSKGVSKVVDANGEPLVVYHGSQNPWTRMLSKDEVLAKWDKSTTGVSRKFVEQERPYVERGAGAVWNTDSETTAYGYADGGEVASNFVALKNPIDLRPDVVGIDGVQKVLIAAGLDQATSTADWRIGIATAIVADNSKLIAYARSLNNDGLIYPDTDVRGRYPHTSFVAFNTGQIKSATDNAGTYDGSNPSTLYQENLLAAEDALKTIANGADSAVVPGVRPDLVALGGTPDVTLVWGNEDMGLYHIGIQRGAEVVQNVVRAVVLGTLGKFDKIRNTVRVTYEGTTAVLSLDDSGTSKSWLLTGWGKRKRPDVPGEVWAHSGTTQTGPIFSRSDLVAGLDLSIGPDGQPVNQTLLQEAWHGSPHRFDRFDSSHMGSGEGAQAFGWGHYFAGKKDLAEWYHQKLTDEGAHTWLMDGKSFWPIPIETPSLDDPKSIEHLAQDVLSSSETLDEAVMRLKNRNDEESAAAAKFLEDNRARFAPQVEGNVYKVDIPDDNEMLDWDKAMEDQPAAVIQAAGLTVEQVRQHKDLTAELDGLDKAGKLDTPEWNAAVEEQRNLNNAGFWMTGEDFYKTVKKDIGENLGKYIKDRLDSLKYAGRPDRAASLYLASIGIPGIRYLDGQSRADGEGSHNYVVFEDTQVNILQTLYQEDLTEEKAKRLEAMEPVRAETISVPTQGVLRWLKDRLQALGTVTNDDTGNSIAMVGAAANKAMGHWMKKETGEVVGALGGIVKKAVFLFSEPDNGKHPKVDLNGVRHYGCLVDLNAQTQLVTFVTNVWKGKETLEEFHNWQVDKKRSTGGLPSNKSGAPNASIGEVEPHKNRIVQAIRAVNPGTLFQDEDTRAVESALAEKEHDLAVFRQGRDKYLANRATGKTQAERDELAKVVDEFIANTEKQLAADRAALAEYQANTGRPGARKLAIQQAVAAGRAVPDAWIEEFGSEPWAKVELERRGDLRDQLEFAQGFDDLDSYVSALMEDRVLQAMGDPFESTLTAEEWDAAEAKARDEASAIDPTEWERLQQVFAIAHAKTPEQLDKEFASSLNADKVKMILTGMRETGYTADKNLPRFVTAQVTKSREGVQNNVNEAEIPRILRAMQNDPRTYRRIAQQGYQDMAELEALALEQQIEAAASEQSADEAPPVIKPIEIPSDMSFEDKMAIRVGTASRMEWQRKAMEAEKESQHLDRALTLVENLSRRWTQQGQNVQTGDSELADLTAVAELAQAQNAKLRGLLRELAAEAGKPDSKTKDRLVKLLVDLTAQIRSELKTRDAARRAYAAQAEEMRKMGNYLSRVAPKTLRIDYQNRINANRDLIDPHFRTASKLEMLQLEAEWYKAHPDQPVPRNRRGELYGKNLNLWTYEELHAAYEERKALEEAGKAAMVAKTFTILERRYEIKKKVLAALHNQGAKLAAAVDAAPNDEERALRAEKYLKWEIERLAKARNLTDDKAAAMAGGGSAEWLTLSNLADNLDGMADYQGINHQTLYSDVNTAENAKLGHTDRRKTKFFAWVKAYRKADGSKMQLGDLKNRVKIEGVAEAYSLDMLLSVYVGQKNELKVMALRFGNRIDQKVFDHINRAPELKWVRDLGNRIIQEYAENAERLFDVAAEHDNIDLRGQAQENYTPMSRRDVNSEGMEVQLSYEAGVAAAVRSANIEHGFTEARVKIDEEHQKPIKLGEFDQWLQMVERQETYIAYSPVVKDLKAIYTSSDVQEAITETYGRATWQEVDKYIKSLANRYHDKTFTPLDRIMNKLTQNAALAFMAYNLGTVMKQVSSLPLFIAHTNPVHLAASLAKLANPMALLKKVDGLSVQMKTRIGYDELTALRLGGNPLVASPRDSKVTRALRVAGHETEIAMRKLADPGMKPMQWVDKLVAAAGWDAAYETAKRDHKTTEQAAIEYADWVVGKTQQSTHAKDTAGVMRNNNSLVKALTLFAGPSVKLYNELVYGIRANVKNGHYFKSLGTLVGLSASALVFYSLGKGAPPEGEEWWQWVLLGLTQNIPIVGGGMASLLQGYSSGNLILNQAIDSAFKTGTSLTKALDETATQAQRDAAWPKVVKNGLDVAGLGFGAPVSPVKRVWTAIETGKPGELVGWHATKE